MDLISDEDKAEMLLLLPEGQRTVTDLRKQLNGTEFKRTIEYIEEACTMGMSVGVPMDGVRADGVPGLIEGLVKEAEAEAEKKRNNDMNDKQ
jgi:hypothetical protein